MPNQPISGLPAYGSSTPDLTADLLALVNGGATKKIDPETFFKKYGLHTLPTGVNVPIAADMTIAQMLVNLQAQMNKEILNTFSITAPLINSVVNNALFSSTPTAWNGQLFSGWVGTVPAYPIGSRFKVRMVIKNTDASKTTRGRLDAGTTSQSFIVDVTNGGFIDMNLECIKTGATTGLTIVTAEIFDSSGVSTGRSGKAVDEAALANGTVPQVTILAGDPNGFLNSCKVIHLSSQFYRQ